MIPLKKYASTILTFLGAAGMVASTVLAVKETPKALAAEKNARGPTKLDRLRAKLPHYIPSIALGAGSLVCIFGANALNLKHQASLRNSYAALLGIFENYRERIRAWHGEETDKAAMDCARLKYQDEVENRPPWDEVQTFYLDIDISEEGDVITQPRFFERTKEQVRTALYYFNREFVTSGVVTVNTLLKLLELDPIPLGDEYGWDSGLCIENYEAEWIDFSDNYFETEDGLTVCSLRPFISPCDLIEASDR